MKALVSIKALVDLRVLALALPTGLLFGASVQAQQVFKSDTGDIRVETVVSGLSNPWGLAFLPDGRMLVTERPGRMRIATRDGTLSAPIAGVPKVVAQNQGGLLDVILDRDFAKNSTIYFCYSDPVDGGGAQTALARARLDDGATPRLTDVRRIFRQDGPPSNGLHFGCRIVQARDGNLFPQWKGNAFIGGLRPSILVRLELDGEKVTGEERMLRQLNERIRDVRTGPDGALYLLTDNTAGRILRLTPAN